MMRAQLLTTLRTLASLVVAVGCGRDASKSSDGGVELGDANGGDANRADANDIDGVCSPFGDPPRPLISAGPTQMCNADGANTNIPTGIVLGPWADPDGTPRYACLFLPATTAIVPLVVYLHPSLSDAEHITATNLLAFLDTTSLRTDGQNPGFAVLAPEGRNTPHFYAAPDQQGTGWDMWYRQLGAAPLTIDGVVYPPNVDGLAIDHFVGEAEATGRIDGTRTFVSGWSNGASFAYAYGLFRSNVKAVAVYSAGTSPFGGGSDPCPQTPVLGAPTGNDEIAIPRTNVPIYQIHNACDIGNSCPVVRAFDEQLADLGVPVEDVIIDNGNQVDACANTCGVIIGAAHHIVWPARFTAQMLAFFAMTP
jgi:predicted esterase